MSGYYNAGDVVLSMAKSAGFPNTALEMLNYRRPLIMGRLVGVGD